MKEKIYQSQVLSGLTTENTKLNNFNSHFGTWQLYFFQTWSSSLKKWVVLEDSIEEVKSWWHKNVLNHISSIHCIVKKNRLQICTFSLWWCENQLQPVSSMNQIQIHCMNKEKNIQLPHKTFWKGPVAKPNVRTSVGWNSDVTSYIGHQYLCNWSQGFNTIFINSLQRSVVTKEWGDCKSQWQ